MKPCMEDWEFEAQGSPYGCLQLCLILSMLRRDPMCLGVKYDLQSLSDSLDTSIVITFHNEPMSTLLRSVHSILNYTPPPLVREILLVDDVSNSTALLPGNELDEYIPFLPKVKLIRMEERNGIVPARMRGIRAASAPVVVILDSHIEVNDGWLEPQLARIQEAPKSFVFPQTLSISSTHFNHHKEAGIGCFVSFDWNVQEKSQVAGFWGSTDAIPSPMHGGGLVAFRKDTFYEIGGYDEGFSMWGAENVELSFRIWMCGARLECAPCAAVYHIFRSMLELKKRLKCKDMNWFMKNVDPKHEFQDLSTALAGLGDIKSVYKPSLCLDSLGETDGSTSATIDGYWEDNEKPPMSSSPGSA
ncbi:UDP-N-acetyl-D-galactosamine:polypeptide N-acetylgalactosaminyltransferase T5, putative [Eimeria praecox]|uniref:UDP-N-acetyl-D-galactosamine:polypeptide N-acetylgalactosaminyltransferase T5, putative n=1 Tax=Eimeria praecox TaxID=51316 RepID=U6GM78_9EIME|nr:UDP-N-acetyl-D-galactosamine:polypeptide N-acetylgalactosaminyltransferase T5, putative [Eimeria praecox]